MVFCRYNFPVAIRSAVRERLQAAGLDIEIALLDKAYASSKCVVVDGSASIVEAIRRGAEAIISERDIANYVVRTPNYYSANAISDQSADRYTFPADMFAEVRDLVESSELGDEVLYDKADVVALLDDAGCSPEDVTVEGHSILVAVVREAVEAVVDKREDERDTAYHAQPKHVPCSDPTDLVASVRACVESRCLAPDDVAEANDLLEQLAYLLDLDY